MTGQRFRVVIRIGREAAVRHEAAFGFVGNSSSTQDGGPSGSSCAGAGAVTAEAAGVTASAAAPSQLVRRQARHRATLPKAARLPAQTGGRLGRPCRRGLNHGGNACGFLRGWRGRHAGLRGNGLGRGRLRRDGRRWRGRSSSGATTGAGAGATDASTSAACGCGAATGAGSRQARRRPRRVRPSGAPARQRFSAVCGAARRSAPACAAQP